MGKAQLNIDGTGVGGKMNRVGMHQLTLAKWNGNSHNKGHTAPSETSYEPGTQPLLAYEGVGVVKDQMIDQGVALAVSTEVEPTAAFFQGPQRVAAEHNNITPDMLIDYFGEIG